MPFSYIFAHIRARIQCLSPAKNEKLHVADYHIEGAYSLPVSKEAYDRYIEGGHGHTVFFFNKKAPMLGWKAEEQRRFFHLRGKPITEITGDQT